MDLDRYVIRYLKENPNVQKEVDKKLKSMDCRVLSVREEVILVGHVVQPGAAADVGTWKAGVEKVFECFMCHYEVDARKIKALLQLSSSGPTSDGVKVYSDVGMAVVVGECSQVSAELKEIEQALVKQKALGTGKTTIRRLGEAKLHLLCDQIKDSLKVSCPDVEVTPGDAGHLALSGPVDDIVEAGKLIEDMEDLVIERMVSDKSPHFLSFLRRVYGAPGALGTLLLGGNEVEIEIGNLELHLFSLSGTKLDETVKKIDEIFQDVKCDVPNCSVVPAELLEQLKSKSDKMNQAGCRVEVVYGLASSLWLLGHTREVEELCQTVAQFILDRASTNGKATLPFPELVHLLPDFLQLHNFDHSGVDLLPLISASGPVVALEGPSGKVTEVINRLDPFLATVVQEKITINAPGAVRFFKMPSGRERMAAIARSQKSLVHFEEQPQTVPRQTSKASRYILQHGIEVLVTQGDMTKQYADALVNAANEQLEHAGGLAGALSTAGGPQVQIESRHIVRQIGKIQTGSAVATTSGNLKCQKLIHVVGPVNGQVGGRERALVEKSVQSALDLAESMQFQSIAIPCISSGLFGVPLSVCSEAIVTAVKSFGRQGGRSLNRIILIDNNVDVVRALRSACDRLLQSAADGTDGADGAGAAGGASGVGGADSADGAGGADGVKEGAAAALNTMRGASAAPPRQKIHVELIHGTIEVQQVDALVSPLASLNLTSTRVGIALSKVAGPQLKTHFDKAVSVPGSKPGDIFVVENLTALKSRAVIFLLLTAWDGQDLPTQILRRAIRQTLSACEERGLTSVAFPLLGTGQILSFPPSVPARVLLEEISAFEQRRNSFTPFVVRVVIHPKDKESFKAFKAAQDAFSSRAATSQDDSVAAPFYRCTSQSTDKVTATVGNVALQLLQGNIADGGVDVVVNSTDFTNITGVCKAILTAAGPSVEQELKKVGIPASLMCSTGPGLLGCKEIIHGAFRSDSSTIRKNCKKILTQCESRRHQSVAFPAINTGHGGMDATKACKAMLDGIATAIRDLNPQSLSLIRIVVMQPAVFKAFRIELESRFGQEAPSHLSMKERARSKLRRWQDKQPGALSPSAPQAQTVVASKPPPAVMTVTSCSSLSVKTVQQQLEDVLLKQQLERQVDVGQISRLDAAEVEALLDKIKDLGISLEYRKFLSGGAAQYVTVGSGAMKEVYVLKGLKEDVLSVVELINRSFHSVLSQDLQDKEEAMLALTVQWSIKDARGAWQEFSLHDNYKLEEAYVGKQPLVDVVTPGGATVSVNLKKLDATDAQTRSTFPVKRNQSDTALDLPANWEPMNDEIFKKVELQKQSQEYNNVAQGFEKTAKFSIQKIERVQNVYLWHAFSVCRQRISKKNGPANLGEKLLYHGTSAESCNCIEKDRFDRNYAGAHAALYGKGVYFAVNAKYSAGRYSPADKSGLKRVYAARVLTGRYTVGKSSMVAPPPRGSDPTDCYDSLVDNQLQPSMFVVFHDDQAYPEYLITFK